jgi:glycosyltransferase involved in cell wall biosynthesis
VAGFLLRVRTRLDRFWDWALGRSGPPLIVVFVHDDGPRFVAMADEIGRSRAAAPRLIVSWGKLEETRFRDVGEYIVLDSSQPWHELTRLRRQLFRRRVELVVSQLTSDAPAARRWQAAALTWRKLLVFNEDGESHRIEARHPIAAWRFLRGAPLADVRRPTRLAFLREWAAWGRVAGLLTGWMLRQGRTSRDGPPAFVPARPGCAVLCLPGSEASQLDSQVAECEVAELVVTPEPLLPESETVAALRRRLQEPGVWLVCGRAGFKHVLGEGWAPHRRGESGTFCLGASSSLFAFRRDVFLELGGLAAFEDQLPRHGWAALSLRGWLRGHRTIYAGDIDARAIKPPPLPAQAAAGPPLASLLPACDSVPAAARLLHHHARTAEFRGAYRAAVRRLRLPPGAGKPSDRLAPLAEPGSMILEGREPGRSLRLAVVAPEPPYPSSRGGAARVHHLLRRLAEHCDLFVFCYARKAADSQLEALLAYCARLVVIQPGPEPVPALAWGLPAGVGGFQTPVMQRHLEILLEDWRIPLVEVEDTQLAMAGSWLRRAPAATILSAPELRFALHRQARENALLAAAKRSRREDAAWRRYELRHLPRFDCIIAASEPDRERLAQKVKRPLLRTVDNGVDGEYFRSRGPDAGEEEVLLIAELEDFANAFALETLLREIWPRIRKARPRAQLTVVAGADYRLHWRRCFRRPLPETPQVTVLGHVGDPRPLYERASVVIAPLAAGGGACPRVLEALAMSRAVVATKGACEGLAAEPGRDLLVESEPAAFAAAVVKLLSDDGLRRGLGQQGRSCVESRYGWDRSAAQQLEVYEELLRNKK